MLFHSYLFIFAFLPVVVIGAAILARVGVRAQMVWLILASLFFYGVSEPWYVALILLSCFVNFQVGHRLLIQPSFWLLTGGLTFNLLLLGYFKYTMFASSVLHGLSDTIPLIQGIVLPLGISFYTFQQMAYLVDSNQSRTKDHDWIDYLFFVTFFPQLIAGPIVHQSEILPQLRRRLSMTQRNFAIGTTIFIMGAFKKVVLAETMADYASPMFAGAANGEDILFLEAWFGTIAYTVQLYFDFSGYSDMAIGLARIFGIRLPLNFNSPLRATSIIEFWQRWHLTLTRFLNMYLYNPVSLRITRWRAKRKRPLNPVLSDSPSAFLWMLAFPTFVTMVLAGIWHGAGWTFLIFGLLHSLYLIVNHAWRNLLHRATWPGLFPRSVRIAGSWGTMMFFLVVSLVYFRADTIDAAHNILIGMMGMEGRMIVTESYYSAFQSLSWLLGDIGYSPVALKYFDGREQIFWTLLFWAIILWVPNTQQIMWRYFPSVGKRGARPPVFRWMFWRPNLQWAVILMAMFAAVLVFGLRPTEFLYWQF